MVCTIWKVLTRRKVLDLDATQETPLARVLNTFDLTALGVGSTLGVGVYVIAGEVAKNTAGPAVILSFLIAAIASVFAGLCYAEFGARTPRAGSAYIYSYLCVGEFIAFVIGWNLILEYIIGSASVAKGLSSYVDNLWNGTMSRTFIEIAPIDIPYLNSYFDFFAFTVPIILSIALAFGMKESSFVNNVFTTLNITVVSFVIIAGSMNAHLSNWRINPENVGNVSNTTNLGEGGFFPFGIEGVIKGAATCFYGFVGFDCIATTGEEVKNPKKAIPFAIICSLMIIFLAYFGTSTVLTLMVPYYEQDPTAPIPFAFQYVHWCTAALVVTIGALFGLYASLFGAMFPLPRILYAMASDGLIFKCLGQVNERFKTPVIGTLLAGLFTGTMAAVFNLGSLVNMMSIGTLLAYTIVAACVLLLRYSVDEKSSYAPLAASSDSDEIEGYSDETENNDDLDETVLTTNNDHSGLLRNVFNFGRVEMPNQTTQTIVSIDICIYCVLCFLLGLCALFFKDQILDRNVPALIAVSVILLLLLLTILSIVSQPVSRTILSFQVPWVPLIPALSILFNIYLMIMLDVATWVRFVVWMVIGVLVFYFTRRELSKTTQIKSSDNHHNQGYLNNGYYGENIVLSTGSDACPIEENVTLREDRKLSSFQSTIEPTESRLLTPTRVLESLDFVIDSFVIDAPASPSVVSVENVSSASDASVALKFPFIRSNEDDNASNELSVSSSKNLEEKVESIDLGTTEVLKDEAISNNNNFEIEKALDNRTEDIDEVNQLNVGENISATGFSNIDTGQGKREQLPSVVMVPPSPPPPPALPPPPPPLPMPDSSISKNQNASYTKEAFPVAFTKVKNKDPNYPMIINAKSLNSVKLRHVERPSLERKPELTEELCKKNKNSPPVPPTSSRKSIYTRSKSDHNINPEKTVENPETNNTNTLPKMEISTGAINSVKLRHVFRPSLSMDEKSQNEERPDSVKFGTPQFQQFKEKLKEKLMNPVNIPRAPSFIDPKKIPERTDSNYNKEYVITDRIDLGKARATMLSEVNAKLNMLKDRNQDLSGDLDENISDSEKIN